MAMARLLYLASEDWYFLSHRLPMARAARDAGYEVHVATRVANGGAAIEAEGFQLHRLTWRRGSTNPVDFIQAVAAARRLYRALAPDLVHQVALWPAIVGSLAAIGLPGVRLSALAGLGFAFTSKSNKAAPFALRAAHAAAPADRFGGGSAGAEPRRRSDDGRHRHRPGAHRLIPGSGVDIDELRPLPEPAGPRPSPMWDACWPTRVCAR